MFSLDWLNWLGDALSAVPRTKLEGCHSTALRNKVHTRAAKMMRESPHADTCQKNLRPAIEVFSQVAGVFIKNRFFDVEFILDACRVLRACSHTIRYYNEQQN